MTSIDFRVVVYEPKDYDWFLLPNFHVDLANQTIAVNTSLEYSPSFTIEPNGWEMNLLQVDLGRSNKFTKYNAISKTFFCLADLVEDIDIGKHVIIIYARFTRAH